MERNFEDDGNPSGGTYHLVPISPREEYHVFSGLNFAVQCKQAMMMGGRASGLVLSSSTSTMLLAAPITIQSNLCIYGSGKEKLTLIHPGVFDMRGPHSLTLGNVQIVLLPSVRLWNNHMRLERQYDAKCKDPKFACMVSATEGGRLCLASCKVVLDDCGSSEKFFMSSVDEEGMRPMSGRDIMSVCLNDVDVDVRHVHSKKNKKGEPRWFLMSMPGSAVLAGEVRGVAPSSVHHSFSVAASSSASLSSSNKEGKKDQGEGGGGSLGSGGEKEPRVEWYWR